MKKFIFFNLSLALLATTLLFAQADSTYNNKISYIESKIAKIKNLPKEQQKQYFSILSDVENRKNILKSLLKTPVDKRDKSWQESWSQNYSKAAIKLESIHTKQ